ncbi:DUF6875 domain-containing protein [Nocardia coffeae]|uniref:DUF6875 domain-containing protein n=1 Tax=Nocardia coffeae TaxID=2873381 RepID=UPI0027E0F8D8|nr:hypothetical protein [Nocardia coffeae]
MRWRRVYRDRADWDRLDPAAAAFTRWVDGHLMHPHPDLGRDGPVCPFVRAGVAHGLLWAGLATGGDGLGSVDLRRIVHDALEQYRDLSAEHPDRDRQLALVTLFPGLTRYERIDAAHLAGKSDAVRHGAMLGQFYPGCGVPGLWNRDFHPLDAPVPMLVLRPMMSTDFPFLAGRADWLYAYFTHLAPDLPRRLRWAIANRMLVEGAAVADITALRAHTRDEHAR